MSIYVYVYPIGNVCIFEITLSNFTYLFDYIAHWAVEDSQLIACRQYNDTLLQVNLKVMWIASVLYEYIMFVNKQNVLKFLKS